MPINKLFDLSISSLATLNEITISSINTIFGIPISSASTITWSLSAANTNFEFDTLNAIRNVCVEVDENHFLNCYKGIGNDGFAIILEAN